MKKESKYSIFAPIVRKNLAKEEDNLGRKLDSEERKKFIHKDIKKVRRKAKIAAVLAAVGISGLVAGSKVLSLPEGQKQIIQQEDKQSKEANFREELKAQVNPINIEDKEQNSISKEIVDQYNKTYNEKLSEDDIGYIKSCPRFLGIDEYGNYNFDYYEENDMSDSVNDNDVGDLYIVVNTNNDEIISAVGEVNFNKVNVDVKQIKVDQKEYKKSDKTINLMTDDNGIEKNNEEKEKIFYTIKDKYQERVNENELDEK